MGSWPNEILEKKREGKKKNRMIYGMVSEFGVGELKRKLTYIYFFNYKNVEGNLWRRSKCGCFGPRPNKPYCCILQLC